jgi:hypothetical protein
MAKLESKFSASA